MPPYDPTHLETLHRLESSHFWFLRRRAAVCRAFERYVSKGARILEIGCGTGFIAEALTVKGFAVEAADQHLQSLRYAQERGIQKVYQFDLFHPPFGAEFDAVCLFDVLEHIRDDAGALKRLKGLLKPGGLLLFTVPAHPWLWCQEDLRAGHERRYSRGALKRLLRTCGFHPLCLRYLFVALLPFLTLRKWVKSDTLVPLHPLVNGVLSALTLLDCCLPNWAGGSLLGVCNADGVDG